MKILLKQCHHKIGIGGLICMLLVTALAFPASVLAVSYTMDITVTEYEGNAYADTPVGCVIGNDWLADNGYIGTDARDTAVEDQAGTTLPHMVTDNTTWVVMDIPASSATPLSYTSNNAEEDFEIITGLGGYVTFSDNETIELLGDWTIEIGCLAKTTAAWIGYNILFKDSAYRLYLSATGKITSDIISGGTANATDIPSGYHVILIETSSGNMTIKVDGNLGGNVVTANVTENPNAWVLGSDLAPYISYLKITR